MQNRFRVMKVGFLDYKNKANRLVACKSKENSLVFLVWPTSPSFFCSTKNLLKNRNMHNYEEFQVVFMMWLQYVRVFKNR